MRRLRPPRSALFGALAALATSSGVNMVTVDEASRIMCAMAYNSEPNLSELLTIHLLSKVQKGETDLDAAVFTEAAAEQLPDAQDGKATVAFEKYLANLRGVRLGVTVVGSLTYAEQKCFVGGSTVAYSNTLDFRAGDINANRAQGHELVHFYIVQDFSNFHANVEKRRIISVGVGDGSYLENTLADLMMSPDDACVLMDLYQENLDRAAQAVRGSTSLTNIRKIKADLNLQRFKNAMPAGEEQTYHVIDASFTLSYVRDLQGNLRDMLSYLEPGGLLVWLDVVFAGAMDLAPESHEPCWVDEYHGVEFYREPSSMRSQLLNAGFNIVVYRRIDRCTALLVARKPGEVQRVALPPRTGPNDL